MTTIQLGRLHRYSRGGLPILTHLAMAALLWAVSLELWADCEGRWIWDDLQVIGLRSTAWLGIWDALSAIARDGATVGLFLVALLRHRSPRRRQLILGSAVVAGVLSLALKLIAHRIRPDGGEGSWPSGHATTVFTLALALSVGRTRPAWGTWAFAVLVAASRVMLARHWPSDLLAGLGVAVVSVALARQLPVRHSWSHWLDDARVLLALGAGLCTSAMVGLLLNCERVPAARGWTALFGLVILLLGIHRLEAGPATHRIA